MRSSRQSARGAERADAPNACLVDTDVISYLFRRDTRAEAYRPYLTGAVPLVSFMTIAELERWMLIRQWGDRRREQLLAFLERFTIVTVDRAMCRVWAEVVTQARTAGRPIQVADAWIAATAVALNVPLLTNNRADFAGVPNLVILPAAS